MSSKRFPNWARCNAEKNDEWKTAHESMAIQYVNIQPYWAHPYIGYANRWAFFERHPCSFIYIERSHTEIICWYWHEPRIWPGLTQLLSLFLAPYTWNLVINWKYIFYIIYLINEPTLKSKSCLKCLYFTKIISDLCRNLEYFSYLYTIN